MIAILQQLQSAKYKAARFEVSSSPSVCGASSSKPTKPRSSSVPLAVSAGSPRSGAEELGEQVQEPLPQVPPVADAGQLQGALHRRLAPCGNARGYRFKGIPTVRYFLSNFLPCTHHEAHAIPHPLCPPLTGSSSCIPLASKRAPAAAPGAGRPAGAGAGQQRPGAGRCVSVPSVPVPVPPHAVPSPSSPFPLRYLQERLAARFCAGSGQASSRRRDEDRRGTERRGSARLGTGSLGSIRRGTGRPGPAGRGELRLDSAGHGAHRLLSGRWQQRSAGTGAERGAKSAVRVQRGFPSVLT